MLPDNITISTASFAPVAPSVYLGLMARRMAGRRWWLFAIPLAVIATGIFTDWRISLIGLMLVFIVYPMVMSLVMLNHALDPDVISRSRTTAATFTRGYVFLAAAPSMRPVSRIPGTLPKSLKLAVVPVKSLTATGGRLIIETGSRVQDFVIVPEAAVSPGDIRTLLNAFSPIEEGV